MKTVKYGFFKNTINHMYMDVLDHGYLMADSEWKFQNVSSPFNRLYLVTKGRAFVENSFHRVILEPGNMYLIPAHSTYDYSCDEDMGKLYFHFKLELFPGRDIFESAGHCMKIQYDKSEIVELKKRIKSKNIKDVLWCKNLLYNSVCRFTEMIPGDSVDWEDTVLKYNEIFDFIRRNLSAGLKVQNVCDYANMPTSELSKSFRKDMGITLKRYIDKMLVQKAKERLLISDIIIKEIAYEMEFSDEFYFSRFFKKHTGLTPSQYRKLNRMNW